MLKHVAEGVVARRADIAHAIERTVHTGTYESIDDDDRS